MNNIIKINQNYSVNDLFNIYGPLWAQHLGLYKIPKNKNKLEIFKFEDFDIKTQTIYKKIFNYIYEKNSFKNINLWAVGSRILGTWRTIEESQELHKTYNLKKIKYSDYDFVTDAVFLPSNKDIQKYIGEENLLVDGSRCSKPDLITHTRKVLIYCN